MPQACYSRFPSLNTFVCHAAQSSREELIEDVEELKKKARSSNSEP